MPSERDQDDAEETSHDERDDDDADDVASDDAAAAAPDVEEQPDADAPRNRAERRLAERRERRGVSPSNDRNVRARERAAEQAAGVAARPRVPPRTITGKSSADEVAPWARGFVDWMARHRRTLVAGGLVVVLVAGSTVGWVFFSHRRNARAAEAFAHANTVYLAEIRAADAAPDPPSAPPRRNPTYLTLEARARAAADEYHAVSQRFPTAPIAPLARLGEATALYELGRYDEARRLYESLVGNDTGGQQGRVLEGLAFTLEAQNHLEDALRRFEQLAQIDDAAYRDNAIYHQARIQIRLNHTDRARELLHALVERLNRTRPQDPLAAASQSSVFDYAQALLRDIAPDDPVARRAPADPEAMIRALQRNSGQRIQITRPGGGGAGGGGSAH